MTSTRTRVLILALLCGVFGFATEALSGPPHFLPKSQAFWDDSKNWTTEYGPAYRDTIEKVENMVPCTGRYALCFQSGPEPFPCELTKDGRFANCTCTVEEGLNFVLITAILNYEVYRDTVARCKPDGSDCSVPDTAPVCKAIRDGTFLPGASLISTFSPDAQSAISDVVGGGSIGTVCPKGPYAGCMTAPCKTNKAGDAAQCSCPVFWGTFMLTEVGAACHLGNDLVWSASFSPLLLLP